MPVPSTPQDLINLIREKLFNNTSGRIDEPSIREVLEWMVKVLDAKFSLFSPELTEEQYSKWNLMLDYMVRETKGVLTTTSPAPTGASAKGKYILSGPGTYTNLGGLVATADKLNYAYFNGTTWSLIGVNINSDILYQDAQYLPNGNVVLNDLGQVLSCSVKWADGTDGTLTNSNYNNFVFQYEKTIVTHGSITVVYESTFDANGNITTKKITIS